MKKLTKSDIYLIVLFILFLGVWILTAINPVFREDWLLENYLVFTFIFLFFVSWRYMRLSNVSYTLVAIFLMLHLIGAHYAYKPDIGYTLGQWFGTDRNMYDRLMHFLFGLLVAYPIREFFMRVARFKGLWVYSIPFMVTLSFSALYEIGEWIIVLLNDPAAGEVFLGAQGDKFDTQKDMFLASVGTLFAMLITYGMNILPPEEKVKYLKKTFGLNFRV